MMLSVSFLMSSLHVQEKDFFIGSAILSVSWYIIIIIDQL